MHCYKTLAEILQMALRPYIYNPGFNLKKEGSIDATNYLSG